MRFHHLGLACSDLELETATLSAVGYSPEREDFVDPHQGVRGRFLTGGGPRLELLVAMPGSEVLASWTSRGVRIYHIAYEVPSLESALDTLRAEGARVVSHPAPAVAFDGRSVAFAALKTLQLIELVQAASPDRPGAGALGGA
ncbi:MAG TPA: VOC family protein [Acidimicrobiales bacterium]|nr:VOC family protein [Acidimicrobiales bacterium]